MVPCLRFPSEGREGGGAGKPNEVIRIALLPKLKGIGCFTSCYQGAQQAADELDHVELIYNGPSTRRLRSLPFLGKA